jgi:LAS superfamily LD-carboxypeptidase LdcB
MTAPDPLRRIDTSKLRPDFLARLRGLLGAASAHGLTLVATEGYRSPERSDELYKNFKEHGGPRAAPGGRSAHNYGRAVDFLALRDGATVPNSDAPEYDLLAELAARYGLRTLQSLNDAGHVEDPDWETLKAL